MPSERATRIDSLSCAAVQAGGQEGGGRQGVGQEERVEGLVQLNLAHPETRPEKETQEADPIFKPLYMSVTRGSTSVSAM